MKIFTELPTLLLGVRVQCYNSLLTVLYHISLPWEKGQLRPAADCYTACLQFSPWNDLNVSRHQRVWKLERQYIFLVCKLLQLHCSDETIKNRILKIVAQKVNFWFLGQFGGYLIFKKLFLLYKNLFSLSHWSWTANPYENNYRWH
jgi:hypothetical protein